MQDCKNHTQNRKISHSGKCCMARSLKFFPWMRCSFLWWRSGRISNRACDGALYHTCDPILMSGVLFSWLSNPTVIIVTVSTIVIINCNNMTVIIKNLNYENISPLKIRTERGIPLKIQILFQKTSMKHIFYLNKWLPGKLHAGIYFMLMAP